VPLQWFFFLLSAADHPLSAVFKVIYRCFNQRTTRSRAHTRARTYTVVLEVLTVCCRLCHRNTKGFPESSLEDVASGHIASVDATGADLDPEWMSGRVVVALTSRDCLLTSITLSHATGLEGAKLALVLSESVFEQLGKSLRVLRVAGCGLTGIIPAGLWRLCLRLEVVDLAMNRLEGAAFPHHGTIGCKGSIRVLSLAHNRLLAGELPAWLGHCRQLQLLTLSQTQIAGNLPQQLGRLLRLREFRFAGAAVVGSVPRTLGWLGSLEVIDLSSGQLNGTIPAELGQCTNLRELKLGANQFNGPIPPELSQCSRLRVLDLSDNLLHGEIPEEFGASFPELRMLNLQQNQLSGSIPKAFAQMAALREMLLSDNVLTGSIAPEFANLSQLEVLSLEQNRLTGSLPPALGVLEHLREVRLHENQIGGKLPTLEWQALANLQELELFPNRLPFACFC
jgi:Leucine-rich repeat (LRR) protein